MKRFMLALPALLLLAGCADTPMAPELRGDPPADPSLAQLADFQAGPALAEGSAVVIDFEGLASPGSGVTYIASWSEDGFTVSDPANPGIDAFGAPESDNAGLYQGSTALISNWPGDATVLTKDDGGEFDASSIAISELGTSDTAPIEITFTGTRADASTVSATFTTDGVPGFETFAFTGFTGLVSLSWIQVAPYYQFDDITVALQAAEEPPTEELPPDDPPDDPPDGPVDPTTQDDPPPAGPTTKADCKKGGWEAFGFRNQGLCVSFVETGRDKR